MQTTIADLGAIIARAQLRDPAAYEIIYHRYVDALYRYLCVRCADDSIADEVLGELWLRVVMYLPHFRAPAQGVELAFTGWLYRIARNLAIDMLRESGRVVQDVPETIPSDAPELDQYVLKKDDQLSLESALARLTVEQREVILLRFREELTSAEVATVTGRTETAVKALQHRALGALARSMGIERHRESSRV